MWYERCEYGPLIFTKFWLASNCRAQLNEALMILLGGQGIFWKMKRFQLFQIRQVISPKRLAHITPLSCKRTKQPRLVDNQVWKGSEKNLFSWSLGTISFHTSFVVVQSRSAWVRSSFSWPQMAQELLWLKPRHVLSELVSDLCLWVNQRKRRTRCGPWYLQIFFQSETVGFQTFYFKDQ